MTAFSDTLIERLVAADRVSVLTGAGISAESGVPTFRDPGGLWEKMRPEELANFSAFLSNPTLVQGWYAHRRHIVEVAQPNAGHVALAELETLYHDFTLVTQNVDDLHRRAGSRNIVELHGNIMRNYCVDCGQPADEPNLASPDERGLIVCTECSGLVRPDVVWFGEMLPLGAFEAADAAARRAEVFLSVGTSAIVYPAAGLPGTAKIHGAFVAELNIRESVIADDLHEVVLGPAATVLPDLVRAIKDKRPPAK
ncbi:MAG: NAD-dependent deacylase [Rhodothermia bacterium]|nr:NAD-dependent deacylase [Rhodothermia bacterium]